MQAFFVGVCVKEINFIYISLKMFLFVVFLLAGMSWEQYGFSGWLSGWAGRTDVLNSLKKILLGIIWH